MKPQLWYCCNCGNGPFNCSIYMQCIDCQQELCDGCIFETFKSVPSQRFWPNQQVPRDAVSFESPILEDSIRLDHEHYDENKQLPFSHVEILGHGRATVDSIRMNEGKQKGKVFARKSVAVKGPQSQRLKDVESLTLESHIMATLPHSHICPVVFTYDLSRNSRIQSFGIIMGVVADMNLAEYLEDQERKMKDAGAGGRLPILNDCRKNLLCWSGCLIRALSFIHSHRIRHRDIKPANILIKDSNVLISDFGISKSFERDVTTMTVTDPNRHGTPRYWAPEVASEWPNSLPRTRLSDVWSMGCVLLEVATMMDNGFVSEYRELPLKYFERTDDILQRIAGNQSSSRTGGLDFLCFLMLNPHAEYRLRSDELAWVLETLQIPTCKKHDCRAPDGIPTQRAETAIKRLREISRKGLFKWNHINRCINETTKLREFLTSKDPARSSSLLLSDSTTLESLSNRTKFRPSRSDTLSTVTGGTSVEGTTSDTHSSDVDHERSPTPPNKWTAYDVVNGIGGPLARWYSTSTYASPILSVLGLGISLLIAPHLRGAFRRYSPVS